MSEPEKVKLKENVLQMCPAHVLLAVAEFTDHEAATRGAPEFNLQYLSVAVADSLEKGMSAASGM